MDEFQKVLIREKNPSAPELAEVMETLSANMPTAMAGISVPDPILQWSRRMKAKDLFPTVYAVHLPCDHLTALMAVRYGQAVEKWPTAFSPADLARALAWEAGKIPEAITWGQQRYQPLIAGGANLTDYMEAQIGNHQFRTELTTITAWSTPLTPAVGDIVKAVAWNDTMFECVVSGAVGGAEPAWSTGIGTETTDGAAVWIAVKVGLPKRGHFLGLYTAVPGETGLGTEVTGGSYARVLHAPTDANWTASVQFGAAGRNDNAVDIVFPTPTAAWGLIQGMAFSTRLTGGNIGMYSALGTPKSVNNGDPAPKFAAGALDVDWS